MVVRPVEHLPALYEADETAWLEEMVSLIRAGRREELDYEHLAEYLTDMAKRDRREVKSRLKLLLAHLLKWEYQPAFRSRSWQSTIFTQQEELAEIVGRGVLRAHAEAVLADAYVGAVRTAVSETGLDAATFPAACPYTLDQALTAVTVDE